MWAHRSCFRASSCVLFLEFWSPRCSLLRYTFLHDSLRWTFSFLNFCVTHRGLGEFDCVIRSEFSNFLQDRILLRAILGHTDLLNSLLQYGHCSFSATSRRLPSRRKLQAFCFPLKAFSPTFLSTLTFFPTLTLDQYSCLNPLNSGL